MTPPTSPLQKRLLDTDDAMCIQAVEYDTDTVYLLGFFRDENGIASRFFVARLIGDALSHIRTISCEEHTFYVKYKDLESKGFTRKSYEWPYMEEPLDTLKSGDYSLARLHREHTTNA